MLLFCFLFFFFNDTATTEIYTLSLHDALPISPAWASAARGKAAPAARPAAMSAARPVRDSEKSKGEGVRATLRMPGRRAMVCFSFGKIGRAHVLTPVTL